MNKLLIIIFIIFNALATTTVSAATIDTLKVYAGDRGGVVTVNKHVYNKKDDKHITTGVVTISDILLDIRGDDIDDVETSTDDELVVDLSTDSAKQVSGRIRFRGARFVDEPHIIKLNGSLHSLAADNDSLKLQDITVTLTEDGRTISGIIIVNGVEYEFETAPENVQSFVRRLLIWIAHQ